MTMQLRIGCGLSFFRLQINFVTDGMAVHFGVAMKELLPWALAHDGD